MFISRAEYCEIMENLKFFKNENKDLKSIIAKKNKENKRLSDMLYEQTWKNYKPHDYRSDKEWELMKKVDSLQAELNDTQNVLSDTRRLVPKMKRTCGISDHSVSMDRIYEAVKEYYDTRDF